MITILGKKWVPSVLLGTGEIFLRQEYVKYIYTHKYCWHTHTHQIWGICSARDIKSKSLGKQSRGNSLNSNAR